MYMFKNLERIECAFADDVVVMIERKEDLQTSLEEWKEILENRIRIIETKIKVTAVKAERLELKIH